MKLRTFAAVAAMTASLAACGSAAESGGTTSASAPAAAAGSGSAQDAQLKFAQCMRENGIDMPDPQEGRMQIKVPEGTDKAKVDEAHKKCDKFLKEAAGERAGGMDPERRDKMVKFAQCLRENGVDVPDPGERGIMISSKPGDEDKVKKAQDACKHLAPGGPGQPS
ncbi:hypothetical protein [Nonomuraea longicatena]|uniref:Secreted protein n=1 Tax=Nonomuraea longicatena TaxID=83682 RepID=A0ABP4B1Z9_9ACTN